MAVARLPVQCNTQGDPPPVYHHAAEDAIDVRTGLAEQPQSQPHGGPLMLLNGATNTASPVHCPEEIPLCGDTDLRPSACPHICRQF